MASIFVLIPGKTKWDTSCPLGMIIIRIIQISVLEKEIF